MALPSFSNLPKPMIPVVAGVGGLGVGLLLFFGQAQQTSRFRQQLALSQQRLAELDAHDQELTRQLQSLETDRDGLQSRVNALQSQLTSASSDLERSRSTMEELRGRFDRLTEERSQLQAQVTALTSERDTAKERLAHLEQDKSELERSVRRLRERLTLLDRDYRQLSEKVAQIQTHPVSALSVASASGPLGAIPSSEESPAASSTIQGTVELPPIIVRKDQAGMSMPVRGRLLEVNEPHNFIVVDKGSADGVRVGMIFDILRGSTVVGRATVVRVRPQLAACDIIRAKTSGVLQPGDTAVQSGL